MSNFLKMSLQEIADYANKLALEQGEAAREAFMSLLIDEYHANLA